jgi:hypothetical protein
MLQSISTSSTLIIFFSLISCGSIDGSNPPDFNDGGKAVNALKNEWKCEDIKFDHPSDGSKDSVLSIRIINSTSGMKASVDEQLEQFKSIASQIKHALTKPERYNEFHISLVKSTGNSFAGTQSTYTYNASIPVSELK